MFKKYLFIFILFLSFLSLFFSAHIINNNMYFPIKNKNYYISSYFEYRTLGTYHFHNGIDIPLIEGTPLYALSDGIVNHVGFISGYGHSIIIKYNNGYISETDCNEDDKLSVYISQEFKKFMALPVSIRY